MTRSVQRVRAQVVLGGVDDTRREWGQYPIELVLRGDDRW
jgi:hypothetical protein